MSDAAKVRIVRMIRVLFDIVHEVGWAVSDVFDDALPTNYSLLDFAPGMYVPSSVTITSPFA